MRRFFTRLAAVLLLAGVLSGCRQPAGPETVHLSGATMGTTWSVTMHSIPAGTDLNAIRQQLLLELERINRLMSSHDPNSEISRFNDQTTTDWFSISAETAQVVELSLEISRLTGGAFDISVGPLVELWGFGAGARGETLPDAEQIRATLSRVGYRKLELRSQPAAIRKQRPDLRIDLSAIAKGYAVDVLADLLEQQGIRHYLVEIGGELRIAGQRSDGGPWRIAIEKPRADVREVERVFPLSDIALATSGNYRNFYVENGQHYAHTIDPVSGRPIRHKLASVTVLDPSAARADALATALMVLGEEKGRLLCESNRIAAFFLIHEQTTTVTYATPAFREFVKEPDE